MAQNIGYQENSPARCCCTRILFGGIHHSRDIAESSAPLSWRCDPMTVATQVWGHANARCIQHSLPAVLQTKVHWPVPAAGDAEEQMGLCQGLPSAERGCWTDISLSLLASGLHPPASHTSQVLEKSQKLLLPLCEQGMMLRPLCHPASVFGDRHLRQHMSMQHASCINTPFARWGGWQLIEGNA